MNFITRFQKKIGVLATCILCCTVISSCWASDESSTEDVSAAGVLKKIAANGVNRTVTELYSSPEKWSLILGEIEMGDPVWISVAVKLYSGADAGAGEMLGLSLGGALSHAPEQVFEQALASISLQVICSTPDVDNPKFSSYELVINEIEKRKANLLKIQTPNLSGIRDECIQLLDQAKHPLKDFFEIEQ